MLVWPPPVAARRVVVEDVLLRFRTVPPPAFGLAALLTAFPAPTLVADAD